MIDKLNLPEEHQTAFRRMLRILPDGFREDEAKMQALLVYLKLGGEKLARQRLDIAKRAFQREFVLFKRVPGEDRPDDDEEDDDDVDGVDSDDTKDTAADANADADVSEDVASDDDTDDDD
ncbi:MAG: hypothetical protein JEZ11_16710 [Desulfobacterales bacterium]|nr:hypothetical protein [Desulfobacterales bacterium]